MSKDDQETAEDYKDDTVVPGEPAVVSNVFFFHLSSLETKDGWKRKKKNKTKCNTIPAADNKEKYVGRSSG